MKVIHTTPVLVDTTSKGKKKYWQGFVAEDGAQVVTYTEFWQDGAKRQQSAPTVVQGKNIGKANETTPAQQAVADIKSDLRKKEKKGYVAEGAERTRVLPLPMLAHSYGKRGHDIQWPCHAQPKLDGVRCLTDGVNFWSREGNLFPEVAIQHLQGDTRGAVLDGELMLDPEQYTFEETISAVKDGNPDTEKALLQRKLRFHVFDVLNPDAAWVDRLAWLRGLFARPHPGKWQLVPTTELTGPEAVQSFLDECLERGHEGVILRNKQAPYKLKHRSKDLQKHKPFVDEEFKIVGYKEGVGKLIGTPVWQCETTAGKVFEACPAGTFDHKRRLWQDRDKLVGKAVTVTYQNFTEADVPRFPIAKAIRDYE